MPRDLASKWSVGLEMSLYECLRVRPNDICPQRGLGDRSILLLPQLKGLCPCYSIPSRVRDPFKRKENDKWV